MRWAWNKVGPPGNKVKVGPGNKVRPGNKVGPRNKVGPNFSTSYAQILINRTPTYMYRFCYIFALC